VKWSVKCGILILIAIAIAIVLRLPQLERRPMHGDEAVHAVKFGLLLEKGFYQYDPHEYHGPTLNYFTLIPVWLSSTNNFSDIHESTLRIVPVFFGVLLVLLPLLLIGALGTSATFVIVSLMAISPAMVFYSRYYIQEIMLVCFSFGVLVSGFRYTQSKNFLWALLTGLFLGLMHATKETSMIVIVSMLLALWLTWITRKQQDNLLHPVEVARGKILWHGIAAIVTAVSVSVLLYSSFFSNIKGILDSYQAYNTYFDRGTQNEWHIHPWYYYIKMLIYSKYPQGPPWSEAFIFILAIIGFVTAMTRKGISGIHIHLIRFIAFYTITVLIIYSLIPYKTPWNLLGFLSGLILLAGVGSTAIIKFRQKVAARITVILLLAAGGAHLIWQAYLANYTYSSDPVNPYVYAHPVKDVVKIAQQVERIAAVHPDGKNMYIQIICPDDDYWPLPWYLRSFPNIGWWNTIDEDVPNAPLIIASPIVEPALNKKLYEDPPPGEKHLYLPLFSSYTELRPGVELRGYVKKDLWDLFE